MTLFKASIMITRNMSSSKKILVGITAPLLLASFIILFIFYFLSHQQPSIEETQLINFLSKGKLLADQVVKDFTLLPKDGLVKGGLIVGPKNELEEVYNEAMNDFNALIDTFIYCLNQGNTCIEKLEDYIKAAQTSKETLKKLLDNKIYKGYRQYSNRKALGINVVTNNSLEGLDKTIKSLEEIMAQREMFERIIEQVKTYKWLSLPKS